MIVAVLALLGIVAVQADVQSLRRWKADDFDQQHARIAEAQNSMLSQENAGACVCGSYDPVTHHPYQCKYDDNGGEKWCWLCDHCTAPPGGCSDAKASEGAFYSVLACPVEPGCRCMSGSDAQPHLTCSEDPPWCYVPCCEHGSGTPVCSDAIKGTSGWYSYSACGGPGPGPSPSPPAPPPSPPQPNPPNGTLCTIIKPHIPSFCSCTDKTKGGKIDCAVNMLGVDTIEFIADFEPCADPAFAAIEVKEDDLGIDWKKKIETGDSESIPIPHLSIKIPVIGEASVHAVVGMEGNIEKFSVSIGLDACIDAPIVGEKCGEELMPKDLPIWLLKATLDFNKLCDGKNKVEKALNQKVV